MDQSAPKHIFGLYESVLNRHLHGTIAGLDPKRISVLLADLDPSEAPVVLSRYLAQLTLKVLREFSHGDNAIENQLAIANKLISLLATLCPHTVLEDKDPIVEPRLLQHLLELNELNREAVVPERPGIPLSEAALLVNASGEHHIGAELNREIVSADRVDLLCSFLKWSGYVRLRDSLRGHLVDRRRPMRVITTAYLGATEKRVVDELVSLGAELRVTYETRNTRLHAKAWYFHRETGYSTAYIGSSNLSSAALVDGLEWNVRVSEIDNRTVLAKFAATFDTYWRDCEFSPYDPTRDSERLHNALRDARGDRSADEDALLGLDIKPYTFQSEILDSLRHAREVEDQHRNLIVAATGTGKTMIAAFDYRRQCNLGHRPSLLFIAHREDLLKQSRRVFREVLRDGSFGSMLVAGERPGDSRHVFASIQSLSNAELTRLDPAVFDIVIVDEFHHAKAPTYEKLLNHLTPKELLGLTATPERADGQDVLTWFGGRTTAEVRLWSAIDRGLLCPFQYFGVRDVVDLDGLQWRRGYAAKDLESVYLANQSRAKFIAQTVHSHVAAPSSMRALGFCVSIEHAEAMSDAFIRLGIPSRSVTSLQTTEQRSHAVQQLMNREVNVLFTVDLFNEGVDLPWLDTILLLRPTQSATVFLQQLGRGLRLYDGKSCLTVLEFIGKQHERFRWDLQYGALLSASTSATRRHAEAGFPVMPSGCSVQLDAESSKIVLQSLRRSLTHGTDKLVAELAAIDREQGREVGLTEFLESCEIGPEVVYRNGRSFSHLRRMASKLSLLPGSRDSTQMFGRLLHIDDPDRQSYLTEVLKSGNTTVDIAKRLLEAALFGKSAPQDGPEWWPQLFADQLAMSELRELVRVLRHLHTVTPFADADLDNVKLLIHGQYLLAEIMAAFDNRTANGESLLLPQGGIVRVANGKYDVMLVTLRKSEREYSPSTMYEDYAISPTEFHWQSQNSARPESGMGLRHIQHRALGVTPLLFVRTTRKDDRQSTMPYRFLGPVEIMSHKGERPINITWRLKHAMPAKLFQEATILTT